jgi:hypothetical protein
MLVLMDLLAGKLLDMIKDELIENAPEMRDALLEMIKELSDKLIDFLEEFKDDDDDKK